MRHNGQSTAQISLNVDTLEANTDTLETLTGIVTETAPANDTASSGLNGRLQRIAQRVTTAIASLDLLAPTTTAGAGIAPVVTSALATGQVIKASAGNLYRLNGAATTVAGYFLVHNTTAVPAAGSVTPVKAYPVAIGQAIEVDFNPPLRLGTGISVSFSSAATPYTQTDSATALISGDAV